ncbi:MAG: helix-turn-helix domain-containing protein [Acidimicrobiia bacterium]|jgi:predicted ArsR family transcriptional regulator|nr:helix-turn-helix domain-containing protein [Acidimicrobiia bacterium]
MNTSELERTLSDLTSTLGDPTRRSIYLMVRASVEPMTAAHIAAAFDIHANVARHHLDRLADEGYLEVARRRPEGQNGPGAGRPAKCYTSTDKEIELQFPSRRYDLLADLLIRVVRRLEPERASEIAAQVGHEYGVELASTLELPEAGFDSVLAAVQQAMVNVGFAVATDATNRQLLMSHCPFGRTAFDHPEVVCALDRGIVNGLMEALHHATNSVTAPKAAWGDDCVTTV